MTQKVTELNASGMSVGLVKFALAQIMRGLVIKVLNNKVEV